MNWLIGFHNQSIQDWCVQIWYQYKPWRPPFLRIWGIIFICLNFEVSFVCTSTLRYTLSVSLWQSGCLGRRSRHKGEEDDGNKGLTGWSLSSWSSSLFWRREAGASLHSLPTTSISNHCGWPEKYQPSALIHLLNPRPFWHYIQVDWEVTAMETAILGVLPGSVEFLTIPWAAWLPLFPCVPWLLWAPWLLWVPCAAWVSWTVVLGPGSGEVSVRTTVDWTRACNKHIKRQIEWKSYLKLFRAEVYIWESASFDSTPCNKRLRRPSIPYFSREQCLMSSISRKLNFPQMKCV